MRACLNLLQSLLERLRFEREKSVDPQNQALSLASDFIVKAFLHRSDTRSVVLLQKLRCMNRLHKGQKPAKKRVTLDNFAANTQRLHAQLQPRIAIAHTQDPLVPHAEVRQANRVCTI
jgi:hypothetical protein